MKAIIQCYTPKEIERIARGEQTVKVCKTAPKETPFKVYMYCTCQNINGEILLTYDKKIKGRNRGFRNNGDIPIAGKVVGDYVCENVEKFTVGSLRSDDIEELACLSYTELINYFYKPWELDGKTVKQGKALHIPAVKFYDKPKELSEYIRECCQPDEIQCENCPYCNWNDYHFCTDKRRTITRPPRGWQYVEELDEKF